MTDPDLISMFKSIRIAKRAEVKYWEEVREKASKIRDAYDLANENMYNYSVYKNKRPPFMEPLPKNFKIKLI